MNSKKQLIVGLFLIICGFAGCGGSGPMNPDAHSLVDYYKEAAATNYSAQNRCETDRISCQANGDKDCFEKQNECQQLVVNAFHDRINVRTRGACKATVFGPGSEDDTDGDGIKNSVEFLLGLSPCHKETFQGVNDGDLDSDFDGIPNKSDPNPYCNPQYQSDCV